MLDQEIVFKKQVQGYLCGLLHVSLPHFSVQNFHKGLAHDLMHKNKPLAIMV